MDLTLKIALRCLVIGWLLDFSLGKAVIEWPPIDGQLFETDQKWDKVFQSDSLNGQFERRKQEFHDLSKMITPDPVADQFASLEHFELGVPDLSKTAESKWDSVPDMPEFQETEFDWNTLPRPKFDQLSAKLPKFRDPKTFKLIEFNGDVIEGPSVPDDPFDPDSFQDSIKNQLELDVNEEIDLIQEMQLKGNVFQELVVEMRPWFSRSFGHFGHLLDTLETLRFDEEDAETWFQENEEIYNAFQSTLEDLIVTNRIAERYRQKHQDDTLVLVNQSSQRKKEMDEMKKELDQLEKNKNETEVNIGRLGFGLGKIRRFGQQTMDRLTQLKNQIGQKMGGSFVSALRTFGAGHLDRTMSSMLNQIENYKKDESNLDRLLQVAQLELRHVIEQIALKQDALEIKRRDLMKHQALLDEMYKELGLITDLGFVIGKLVQFVNEVLAPIEETRPENELIIVHIIRNSILGVCEVLEHNVRYVSLLAPKKLIDRILGFGQRKVFG